MLSARRFSRCINSDIRRSLTCLVLKDPAHPSMMVSMVVSTVVSTVVSIVMTPGSCRRLQTRRPWHTPANRSTANSLTPQPLHRRRRRVWHHARAHLLRGYSGSPTRMVQRTHDQRTRARRTHEQCKARMRPRVSPHRARSALSYVRHALPRVQKRVLRVHGPQVHFRRGPQLLRQEAEEYQPQHADV